MVFLIRLIGRAALMVLGVLGLLAAQSALAPAVAQAATGQECPKTPSFGASWVVHTESRGVTVCKLMLRGPGHLQSAYVQIIDLSSGATIRSAFEFENLHTRASPENPQPFFRKRTVKGWYDDQLFMRAELSNWQVSAVNGQWFTNSTFGIDDFKLSQMAYPIKADGEIISGSTPNTEPRGSFNLFYGGPQESENTTSITPYEHSAYREYQAYFPTGADDAIVTLGGNVQSEERDSFKPYPRTWVGVSDADGDGVKETVIILSAQSPTHAQAQQLMTDFGATSWVQMDASGSSQLTVRGSRTMLSSDWFRERPVPHAIVAFESPEIATFTADEIPFPTPDKKNIAIVGKRCDTTQAENVDLVADVTAGSGWSIQMARFMIDDQEIETRGSVGGSDRWTSLKLKTPDGQGRNLSVGKRKFKLHLELVHNGTGATRKANLTQIFEARVRPCAETTFAVAGTQVYTGSAASLPAIEGPVCDPQALQAKGVPLNITVTPRDKTKFLIEDAQLFLDDQQIPTRRVTTPTTHTWELETTSPQDIDAGKHTLSIRTRERTIGTTQIYKGVYKADFKAKPKDCGRAKSDEFSAIIYEGSRCSQQETPFTPLDVLSNDDLSDNGGATSSATWQITSVSGATLGQVKISDDKQQLLYKPSAQGVDTLVYELTFSTTSPASSDVSKATVLVNNRIASSDADCSGGGGGGGGGNNPGGSGTASGWGDPHLTTADGKKFDSHAFGEFIYFQPKAGKTGITVHGRQEIYQAGKFPAITTALAFQIGNRRVEIRSNRVPAVLVDGASVGATALDLGGGASLTIADDLYQIRSSSLSIDVRKNGTYLDYSLTVPLNNTLEGMLGSPNGNVTDDWFLPGTTTIATDAFALAKAWEISDASRSLFTYGPGEDPSFFNKANTFLGQIPTAEQLASSIEQARSLLTTTCDASSSPQDAATIEALALELYIGTSPAKVADQLCRYEISGTITSTIPAGAPMAGLRITMTSPDTRSCITITNRDGRYRCRLAPRPNASAAPTVTVKIPGSANQTVVFPAKAPIHTTISQTLDLAVTLPSVQLTVFSQDEEGNPTPNTTISVSSGDQIQQVTTGADGSAQVLLTYAPATTNASINAVAVAPAYSNTVYSYATLSQNGPVDVNMTIKHRVLDTPAWQRAASPFNGTTNVLTPMRSDTVAAVGADGTIYTVGSVYDPNGKAYRLVATTADGTPKWISAGLGSVDRGGPTIGPDGTIYLISSEYPTDVLYAFNPNGSVKWTFETGENSTYTSRKPAVAADGTVYLVSSTYSAATAYLYALAPADGTTLWVAEMEGGQTTAPPVVGADGTIYVMNNHLRAFGPDGTALGVSAEYTNNSGAISLGSDGTIYTTWYWEDYGDLIAFNPDLSVRWQNYVASWQPVIEGTDGGLYVAGTILRKLNPATGATLWQLSKQMTGTPVVAANGTIYALLYLSQSGMPSSSQLVSISPAGVVQSYFTLRSSNSAGLAMGSDGRVYLNSYSSTGGYDLVAVPTSANGQASGRWSSSFGDTLNTNRAP